MSEATTTVAAPARRTKEVDLGLIARLGAKARTRLDQLKAATARADAAEAKNKAYEGELEVLRKTADSSASAKRVKELDGQIRTGKYRTAFDRLAGDAGVNKGALEDLWSLAKIDTTAEAVDEEAIKAAIEKNRTSRGYMFGLTTEAATARADAPGGDSIVKPAVVSGRAGPSRVALGPQIDEHASMNDAAYAMKNYEKIQASYRAKQGLS